MRHDTAQWLSAAGSLGAGFALVTVCTSTWSDHEEEPDDAGGEGQREEVVRQEAERGDGGQAGQAAPGRGAHGGGEHERERDREQEVERVRAELVSTGHELPAEGHETPARIDAGSSLKRRAKTSVSTAAPAPQRTENQRTASTGTPIQWRSQPPTYQAGGVDSVSATRPTASHGVGSTRIRADATSSCQSG